MMQFKYTLAEIDKAADYLLSQLEHKIYLFDAPMGAGKTTLIKSICQKLGVTDPISSPTFSLVNEYEAKNDYIFHYDLYRIEDSEQLLNIGITDYLDKNAFHLIEWPKYLESYISHYHLINIIPIDEHTRILDVKTL